MKDLIKIVIIEYIVKTPIIVTRFNVKQGRKVSVSIPEGGSIGFCGMYLYERNEHGFWSRLETERGAIVNWIEQHHVERKIPAKTNALEALRKAVAETRASQVTV